MGLLLATGALKKKEKKAPRPRTLLEEGTRTLDAEAALAPRRLGLEREYFGDFAETQASGMGDILDEVGPRAIAAYRAANPDQAALLDELNRQALEELSLGAGLDPSLRREVQQGVREGQTARGLGFGPSDLYEETMTLGRAGQELRARRRAFADAVAGRNQEQLATIPGLAGQAYGGTLSRAPSFDPWQSYAQDLYNTVYNARWAEKISVQNYNAAVTGALIGAIGQIIGGGASAAGRAGCWVAREVFGWNDPRWILFRAWIERRPLLHHVYMRVGPWLARRIHDKPRLKAWLKGWMLNRLNGLKVLKKEGR